MAACSRSGGLLSRMLYSRSYLTGMRRSALKERLLRALRCEIDSVSAAAAASSPSQSHFNSFSVDPCPGQRSVRLTRSDDLEDITIDATMVDGAAPAPAPAPSPDPATGTHYADPSHANARLHISLAVQVASKGSHSLHFLCSAWPDAIDVHQVYAAPPTTHAAFKPYLGPPFKDFDDDMKAAVLDYLEHRGVTDHLASFLHSYMPTKATTEHIKWLKNIESYVHK